jgi:hypothetical protein
MNMQVRMYSDFVCWFVRLKKAKPLRFTGRAFERCYLIKVCSSGMFTNLYFAS